MAPQPPFRIMFFNVVLYYFIMPVAMFRSWVRYRRLDLGEKLFLSGIFKNIKR